MRRGGANTVVLPRDKRFKISDNVSLPLFGEIDLHLPDFFVIKIKKGYKLVSPVTKTGAISSRKGEKAFKIIKNESNELFLHEPSFPKIHLKEFSKKDRDTIEKYFHKIQSHHSSILLSNSKSSNSKSSNSKSSNSKSSNSKSSKSKHSFVAPSFIDPATGSSVSTISTRSYDTVTDVTLPSGKKKYNVYKTREEEKSDQKKERNVMASQDTRRISRLARIASKKQGKGAKKTRRRKRI
jgi:hypothetical protein